MILSLLLFSCAAVCNAVMDTCTFHFYTSVFNTDNFKNTWWNADISWKNKYIDKDPTKGRTKTPVFLTDAWHFFKSLMIVLICASMCILALSTHVTHKTLTYLDFFYMFLIYGFAWNVFFSVCYNRLFLLKKQ